MSNGRECATRDYPHTEDAFPRSQQQSARGFVGVPEVELRKIVPDNAAQLYGVNVAYYETLQLDICRRCPVNNLCLYVLT